MCRELGHGQCHALYSAERVCCDLDWRSRLGVAVQAGAQKHVSQPASYILIFLAKLKMSNPSEFQTVPNLKVDYVAAIGQKLVVSGSHLVSIFDYDSGKIRVNANPTVILPSDTPNAILASGALTLNTAALLLAGKLSFLPTTAAATTGTTCTGTELSTGWLARYGVPARIGDNFPLILHNTLPFSTTIGENRQVVLTPGVDILPATAITVSTASSVTVIFVNTGTNKWQWY